MLGKKILVYTANCVSLAVLFISLGIIISLFSPLAKEYISLGRTTGGDYFNGLTYATHFAKQIPFPPSGWLNFWHEGNPTIGGYPLGAFYAMAPLFTFFDPAVAMEYFSIYTHLLFLLISLCLFWYVTKGSPIALILTIILFLTRGTYYQLFGEGLVVAANMQWLLPTTLFFVYLYVRKKNNRFLAMAGISSGIGIMWHPALAVLTIVFPSAIIILFSTIKSQKITKTVATLLLYLIAASIIGASSIYTLYRQTQTGAISGSCASTQCWGIYPEHFYLWFSPYTLLLLIPFLIGAFGVKIIKRTTSHSLLWGCLIASVAVSLYLLAAYLHQINTITSAIFPRRIFWCINLLLLLTTAEAYNIMQISFGRKSRSVLFTFSIVLTGTLLTTQNIHFDTTSIFNHPATIPDQIEQYILPKYQTQQLNELMPQWVMDIGRFESNYRFDSLNQQVNHWWNIPFSTPAVRGYSNSPSGPNANWLYYFQVGTAENKPSDDPQLIRNRSLFLLDHFAVRLYEDSTRNEGGHLGYDQSILDDSNLIIRKGSARELRFYEISPKYVSPIVTATNAKTVLIVGDPEGFKTIVKTISFLPYNSQQLLPIKGPESINQLNEKELDTYSGVILYRFTGTKWKTLEEYVEGGGSLFVETGSAKTNLRSLPETLFPNSILDTIETKNIWNLKGEDSPLISGIDFTKFSPLIYENGPWKLNAAPKPENPLMKEIFTQNDVVLMTSGTLGKGKVIWSGINVPFHIIQAANFTEALFFKNILNFLISDLDHMNKPETVAVTRSKPELIEITGENINGIYFKENYHPGWKATVNGNHAPVLVAGLDFMYVPVNQQKAKIVLTFKGTLTTWGIFWLMISSVLLLLAYAILPIRVTNQLFVAFSRLIHWERMKLTISEHE